MIVYIIYLPDIGERSVECGTRVSIHQSESSIQGSRFTNPKAAFKGLDSPIRKKHSRCRLVLHVAMTLTMAKCLFVGIARKLLVVPVRSV